MGAASHFIAVAHKGMQHTSSGVRVSTTERLEKPLHHLVGDAKNNLSLVNGNHVALKITHEKALPGLSAIRK